MPSQLALSTAGSLPWVFLSPTEIDQAARLIDHSILPLLARCEQTLVMIKAYHNQSDKEAELLLEIEGTLYDLTKAMTNIEFNYPESPNAVEPPPEEKPAEPGEISEVGVSIPVERSDHA